MRFSTIFLSTVVAALSVQAQANNGTATTVSPVVSGTAKPNAGQQATTVCLEACPSNDNDCRAKCQLLANSVNPKIDCQAACPKGDGSAAANLSYRNCFQSCASISPEPTASETSRAVASSTPTGTGSGSGTGTGSGTGSGSGGASSSGSGSDVKASGTGAAPSATKTGAAANMAVSVSVGAGLGLFAMMLAL
ncbi:hypothetical protein VC83_08028 [Pseudogymnoascus destructans]|uniref:Extracellular membrane protein CFEM domain-containing protein n=2 Tax=Pseudogymnoascus destructans TaxID=655981 RepID=L8G6B0_PSED2|nr:uncharacterized protein VC83_08028 [Pseudogymnoascus destructans]ELR08208.1 hypothetical protein GMDG_03019 [Pseudogymnoascus destructans 20631-21]OAF55953.1 hypothetical protein VC83_08028 [Pseudogymnoascus destructans]